MENIIVYSKSDCPYCESAKALLEHKGLVYTEIDVSANPDKLSEMIKRRQRRTVPQIFINDEHIGGSEDLQAYLADEQIAMAA